MTSILSDKIYKGLTLINQAQREEWGKRKRKAKGLTASIITACRRSNWYNLKNIKGDEENEIDPELLAIFRDGNDHHEFLGQLLEDIGIKVIDTEYTKMCQGISTRVDRMVKIDDIVYDLEFKTTDNVASFNTFVNYGTVAFPGYYAQAQVILGSVPKRPLIELFKCGGKYCDELVEINEDYIANLVKVNEEFISSMVTDTPPEKDFTYNSTQCEGCEHKFKCWFSYLRMDTIREKDLSKEEKKVIDSLYNNISELSGKVDEYNESYKTLKDYIAYIHTKHAVSKVKLNGITSSMVITNREYEDKEYIKSILSGEQLDLAFYTKPNKFFRTIVK